MAWLISPFNAKAKKAIVDRKSSLRSLSTALKENDTPIIWFHAASLGEFEQGLPVMERVKSNWPEKKILVTFFSPSGFDHRKDHPICDFVAYLPWDTASNAKEFLKLVQPEMACFIKYEYWYFHLRAVNRANIPLLSLSALFTPNHIFFKWYGALHRKMLKFFDHTFVQNESSKTLLKQIGIEKVIISGDTRFDRVKQTVSEPKKVNEIKSVLKNEKTVVLGSVWPEDMEILSDFINENQGVSFIIAPHLVDNTHVEEIEKFIERPSIRYTEITQSSKSEVLILNTIGLLSHVYQYGDLAYIGGAFGDGLHNILEAVAFGLPVVFGNNGLEKFPESIELQKLGGGFSIRNKVEATEILSKLVNDVAFRKSASKICLNYVDGKAGATDIIMNYLCKA